MMNHMATRMLQSTINSWNFFLENATGDIIFQLSQQLYCKCYSPSDILTELFDRYCDGLELPYEGLLLKYFPEKYDALKQNSPIELLEDVFLVDVIHTSINRCAEDERDLLLDILGFESNVKKKDVAVRLISRAESMDRFLLPGVAMLLINPKYYKTVDFASWPFRLDHYQLYTLEQIRNHVPISHIVAICILLISFHRSSIYAAPHPEAAKDIYSIPPDIFSNPAKSLLPYVGILPKKEFVEDITRFRELIQRMTEWSGHQTRENVETMLRVLTGYPFEASQEKIIWDGRQFRTLLYIVKYMFDSKPGRGLKENKYPIIMNNTLFDPDVDPVDFKMFQTTEDMSKQIGYGKGVSREIKNVLHGLYPTIYKNA